MLATEMFVTVFCRVVGTSDNSPAAEARNMIDVIIVKDCNKDSTSVILYENIALLLLWRFGLVVTSLGTSMKLFYV